MASRNTPIEISESEKFIKIWQQSKTVDDVVRELKMDKAKVLHRANYFRSNKIPLKKMPKGINPVDWDALKRLAEKYSSN